MAPNDRSDTHGLPKKIINKLYTHFSKSVSSLQSPRLQNGFKCKCCTLCVVAQDTFGRSLSDASGYYLAATIARCGPFYLQRFICLLFFFCDAHLIGYNIERQIKRTITVQPKSKNLCKFGMLKQGFALLNLAASETNVAVVNIDFMQMF